MQLKHSEIATLTCEGAVTMMTRFPLLITLSGSSQDMTPTPMYTDSTVNGQYLHCHSMLMEDNKM